MRVSYLYTLFTLAAALGVSATTPDSSTTAVSPTCANGLEHCAQVLRGLTGASTTASNAIAGKLTPSATQPFERKMARLAHRLSYVKTPRRTRTIGKLMPA